MGNRILKESICRSEEIDELSWFEEVMFYRLIVNCDDYGIFDARPKVVKSMLFPLKNITEKQVSDALNKLSSVGLVRVYEAQGKPYLQIVTWKDHQRLRKSRHKYPEPPSDADCDTLRQVAASCGELRPEYESNTNTNSNSNTNPNISTEQNSVPDADVEAVILNTGDDWRPTVTAYEEYCRLYPGIDVAQEFRKMRGWCQSNPTKRKTIKGVERFVTGWLSRAQDSCRGKPKISAYMDAIKNRVDVVDTWLEGSNEERGFCNSG